MSETVTIEFIVPGEPLTKGSTRTFMAKSGKPRTTSDTKGLKGWENRVALAAREKWDGGAISGKARVSAEFIFQRPLSHYGTGRNSDRVKPAFVNAIPPKDLDKLCRALCDGMAGVLYRNDKMVAELVACKWYGDRSEARVAVVLDAA